MKFCPNCRITYDDSANVCSKCGTPLMDIPEQVRNEPRDHTAEFDPRDISDNKIFAMAAYLFGFIGIIIAALGSGGSPYVMFHVRQALKIQLLTALSTLLLLIPILGWIAFIVWAIAVVVIEIMSFVRVCQGRAVEPPIIWRFNFLR